MTDSDGWTRTPGLNLKDRSYIIKAWIPDLVSPIIPPLQGNRIAQNFHIIGRRESCGPGSAEAVAASLQVRERPGGIIHIEGSSNGDVWSSCS